MFKNRMFNTYIRWWLINDVKISWEYIFVNTTSNVTRSMRNQVIQSSNFAPNRKPIITLQQRFELYVTVRDTMAPE